MAITVPILGGEDYPQNNSITLNINGGLFTGIMHGDEGSHRGMAAAWATGRSATNATGLLPIGDTSGIELNGTVFVGGPNVVFRGQSDRGTNKPGDTGFTPYQRASIAIFGEVRVRGVPRHKLRLNYVDPVAALAVPAMTAQQ